MLFFGVARVKLRGAEHLFGAFQRALKGESRCILAYRHPNGGEPQLLGWFIIFKMKKLARRAGISFVRKPHTIFVYGYEVVRWGGSLARYIMPGLGALIIHHTKIDTQGMRRIYQAITDGPYPISIAPEGQVSYTTDSVPRLEQGTIRIGFHAAERLEESRIGKGEKSIPVEILPVSVHFRFGPWGKFFLERLIRRIEAFTGRGKSGRRLPFPERIAPCREHILSINEGRYGIKAIPEQSFEERLDRVIEAALKRAEEILGVQVEGDIFARLYSLRQRAWDGIFLPGRESLKGLSRVERGVLDLQAGESWHAQRHVELVDFAWYFRVPIPGEDSPLHHKVEYVQNLWDFANRSMGGDYTRRINIFPRRMIIQATEPIDLTERLPAWRQDRRGAIDAALEDLKAAYMHCIDEVNRGRE